jgi:N-acetylglucosaminyl-diphospho-decaprenol L-rhamnosyltransferase
MGQRVSPAFALVVIHYRDPDAVDSLLASSRTWDHPPRSVFVVDNSSDFGAHRAAEVTVLSPGANVGYGSAANTGIRAARDQGYDVVLLLTQDSWLEPRASALLLDALVADERAAVAAPLLGYRERPTVVFSAGGVVSRVGRATHPATGSPVSDFEQAQRCPVEWADGACLMLRPQAVQEVGGFDPAYFLYVEEVDLQFRLREAGRTILLVPEARAWQSPGNYTAYLKYRNLTYFTRKYPAHFGRWPWVKQLYMDSRRVLRGAAPVTLAWGLRGYVDGARGRMGPPPTSILRK